MKNYMTSRKKDPAFFIAIGVLWLPLWDFVLGRFSSWVGIFPLGSSDIAITLSAMLGDFVNVALASLFLAACIATSGIQVITFKRVSLATAPSLVLLGYDIFRSLAVTFDVVVISLLMQLLIFLYTLVLPYLLTRMLLRWTTEVE